MYLGNPSVTWFISKNRYEFLKKVVVVTQVESGGGCYHTNPMEQIEPTKPEENHTVSEL